MVLVVVESIQVAGMLMMRASRAPRSWGLVPHFLLRVRMVEPPPISRSPLFCSILAKRGNASCQVVEMQIGHVGRVRL